MSKKLHERVEAHNSNAYVMDAHRAGQMHLLINDLTAALEESEGKLERRTEHHTSKNERGTG